MLISKFYNRLHKFYKLLSLLGMLCKSSKESSCLNSYDGSAL